MTDLAYQTLGDPNSPAIMLLHGFMSCNSQWLLNTDALAKRHFLVMVELWGHGDSPTPTQDDCYSIAAYVDQFERIREALDVEHWSLIGQSYGAGLIINYAVQHPTRCDAVVVTNSRSAFGQTQGNAGNQPRASQNPLDNPNLDLRSLPYHPINARRFPQFVQDALVAKADAMSVDAIKLGGRTGARLNCIDLLDQLQPPLLLTNGKFEKAFQSDMENLRSKYPGLRLAHLEGGHSVNIEAAEDFNTTVLDFLAQART